MPKARVEVITKVSNNIVEQVVSYKNRLWFDRKLILNQLRKRFQTAIRLDLPIISFFYEKNKYIIRYEYNDNVDIHEHDGKYFYYYQKSMKTCRNCVSWDARRKYCDWMQKSLMKEIIGCDGFLEKEK